MPYHVGKKGSYGCSGYPALKDDGTVMGCHKTRTAAAGQIYAINRSEGNIDKAAPGVGDFVVFMMEDEVKVGRVEFIMTQPGWLGLPDSEYAVETKEGQIGTLVRCYEEDDNVWEEEKTLHILRLSDLVRIDSLMVERDVVTEETGGTLSPIMSQEMQMMDKADKEEQSLFSSIFGFSRKNVDQPVKEESSDLWKDMFSSDSVKQPKDWRGL